MNALAALSLAIRLASAPAQPDGLSTLSHEDEVKLFSSTLALSVTASNLCADILIDQTMITDFHDRLHITTADRSAVGAENRLALQVLAKAIQFSGSIEKWCDETYEMYGPKGTMIPDLMRR